ncbi:hypothetical protein GCM10010124_39770 [Pilimelia terevasa]|uniref:DUF6879 domain-containing protein n=1 Tax=Pilimelia terevasa TaxID=53372 RepID=A0A8J3FM35_9ACTN|nr:hypothetical protein GCM10010124_39770 [Pilimelia terevasa]
MKELDRHAFLDCLNGIRLSWAHVELRDPYGVPADVEQVERWRRGESTQPAYYADFVPMVEGLTRRGCQIRRVKVVCEPLNDYHRWAYRPPTSMCWTTKSWCTCSSTETAGWSSGS